MPANETSPNPAPIPANYPRPMNPEKYEDGKLTRESMVAIINAGGSIMLNGKIITNLNDLPSLVELATDQQELREAETNLEKQEEQLKAERKKLESRQKQMEEEKPPVEEEETFGDDRIPLSKFKGKTVDEILEEGNAGIGRRKAERIVKLLEEQDE